MPSYSKKYYADGEDLKRSSPTMHQQLSKFSETTDLSGMVWNGLEWSEVSEMSEMSEVSEVSGFRHLR